MILPPASRRHWALLVLLAFLPLWQSCEGGLDQSLLYGRWQAVELLETNEPVDMDLSPVYFEFSSDEKYYFQSTLNLSEAGRYYTVGHLLYTTDTTVAQPLEKAVKIIQLTSDSLAFLMNDKGVEKRLQLVKQ